MGASALRGGGGFALGVVIGAVCGVLAIAALTSGTANSIAPEDWLRPSWFEGMFAMIDANLRGSLFPFVVVAILYVWRLRQLRRYLDHPAPLIERVLRQEQILDLCANLFFGVGVIWTAIGMRAALLHALGSPLAISGESAFTVLQRLVDGGILLALSTTIVGGFGGY